MTCRITPLGNTGYIPIFGDTTCFLVELDSILIIIDSGTGIKKLNDPRFATLIEKYEQINFVFSHYHLDHVIGISYWPKFLRNKRVVIHAPEPPLCDSTFQMMIKNLFSKPLFSLPWEDFPMDIQVVPLTTDSFSIDGVTVSVLHQDHPGGSVTYRFEDIFVFATDTGVNDNTFVFSDGVRLLIHEVWFDKEDTEVVKKQYPHVLKEHTVVTDLVEGFESVNVEKLACTHLNPQYDKARLERLYKYIEDKGIELVKFVESDAYEI